MAGFHCSFGPACTGLDFEAKSFALLTQELKKTLT